MYLIKMYNDFINRTVLVLIVIDRHKKSVYDIFRIDKQKKNEFITTAPPPFFT